MNATPTPFSEQEQLRDVFLQHPETHIEGKPTFLEYSFMRGLLHAMEPGETLEKKKYINGPLIMEIVRIFSDQVESIVSLRIIDTEDGFSAPKRITDVNYLQEVLDILDQDRQDEHIKAIRSYFSKTPDGDGNRRHIGQ